MTPLERYHWQRKNRRVAYLIFAGLVVFVAALGKLHGSL
ncbi:hypothetical protein R16034_00850 [Ralstonia edaphis]|uniref:Uncharacterized protein n=1 Tax=Ralstonia edaphi TaxID=3058599 RepID=A0AB72X4F0_9RALS|nr:hypothetical protein R16034_00850 [Ralstonia sp. LMG 6871]